MKFSQAQYPTKLTSCERDATGYLIRFAYDPDLLGDLKASIPVQYREWIPESKTWHIAEEFAYVISQFFDNFPKIPPPKRKPKTWLQEQAEHYSRLIHDPIYWMKERMADLAAEQLPAISPIGQVCQYEETSKTEEARQTVIVRNIYQGDCKAVVEKVRQLNKMLYTHINFAELKKKVKSKYEYTV